MCMHWSGILCHKKTTHRCEKQKKKKISGILFCWNRRTRTLPFKTDSKLNACPRDSANKDGFSNSMLLWKKKKNTKNYIKNYIFSPHFFIHLRRFFLVSFFVLKIDRFLQRFYRYLQFYFPFHFVFKDLYGLAMFSYMFFFILMLQYNDISSKIATSFHFDYFFVILPLSVVNWFWHFDSINYIIRLCPCYWIVSGWVFGEKWPME